MLCRERVRVLNKHVMVYYGRFETDKLKAK